MTATAYKYVSTVEPTYGTRTVTNTETGHVVTDGDFVTVGKAKTEWRVCYLYTDGRVQLERQAQSPKRGMTRRFDHMDNLTVVYTTRKAVEADDEPTVDVHVFAKGDRLFHNTSPVIYTVTKVTARKVHTESPSGLKVVFDAQHDSLTPAPELIPDTTPALPVVKSVVREITYYGARCINTTTHHDKSATGLRTVRMEWLDNADPKNGGWEAGTVTEKLIKGDAWRNPAKFVELVPEHVIGGFGEELEPAPGSEEAVRKAVADAKEDAALLADVPAPKLSKKNQARYDEWAARVEGEGFHVGQEVMATRVETDARDYVTRQWEEPAVITEVRAFDAVVRFADGSHGSSGIGVRVLDESATAADGWPTVAVLAETMVGMVGMGEAVDLEDAADAADDLFPDVPADETERAAYHARAEAIMNEAMDVARAALDGDTPTPLLHPKREVFDVKASKDGKEVVEVVTVLGSIHRARSVADMLACKYGFGPIALEYHTSTFEAHYGKGGALVEIEDMDPDATFEVGPFDEQLTAEMAAE
ncbi:hypothetical protein ArV1_090 [Arthrobacter phage vB_ArtM-ArV1]|uniref:Uncharacterized protein n=1 Tax=Arthrobacter phage vB_ArtM-ArV1 TaxID=1566993 RepID=A0A0A7HAS2_9CAUD|nr:hypothetical protein ArV1_090 [Arthrobacter phage vB_ArtM-ArV1]AIZ01777.1 hypothetical protein ArV1_090 [Arthrobacter phage vB_ArtM-ArV1]